MNENSGEQFTRIKEAFTNRGWNVTDGIRSISKDTPTGRKNRDLLASRLRVNRLQRDVKKQKELNGVDALTGLGNRLSMNETLEKEISLAQRKGLPLSIIMFDLDHFKKVNDSYGHRGGDELLVLLADFLREKTRKEDGLFRYGGEEFLVVLPNTMVNENEKPLEDDDQFGGAMAMAEKLRTGFEKKVREFIESKNNQFDLENPVGTLSMGVASFREGEDRESLIKRADEALYKAKAAGRNKVVMAEDPKEEG